MKYRVVSVLKDNRPRFLIISDIEEIEILPSKYLKHLDQINASPNTVKSAAFALSYYYNFLQEQTIGLDEITLLSYSEQNKHFIDFLYWVKSGKHTEHNTQTSNKTCNMYLGAVFRYYQFLALEDVLPMLKVLRCGIWIRGQKCINGLVIQAVEMKMELMSILQKQGNPITGFRTVPIWI